MDEVIHVHCIGFLLEMVGHFKNEKKMCVFKELVENGTYHLCHLHFMPFLTHYSDFLKVFHKPNTITIEVLRSPVRQD